MTAQTLSLMALWAATVLYAIAMVAYAIRLARVAEVKGRVPVPAGVGATSESAGVVPDPTSQGSQATNSSGAAYGIARATILVGALLNGVGVVARAIESGHAPWSTMYEYTISGTWVAVVVFLIVQTRRDITFLGAGVAGFAAVALGLGLTILYAEASVLPPALQSFWLIIHVAIAVIATGILAVAFLTTCLQLGRDFRDSGARAMQGRGWRFIDAAPHPAVLEGLSFRLHAVGFVLWTFTVMAGAVWAEHAWGRYWGWDPKEVWSFVIWVMYAAYLHARTTQGWAGRKSAYLAIAGFVAVILNFTVVNLVFQGLHSYAGV